MSDEPIKEIYKYHTFDTHLYQTLSLRKLYLPKPEELNDPYDCKVRFSKQFLITLFKSKRFLELNIPNNFFERFMNKSTIVHDPSQPWYEMPDITTKRLTIKEAVNEIYLNESKENKIINMLMGIAKVHVTCFTTNDDDDSIMWSYYTNKHNGVRLKFDFTDDEIIQTHLYRVKYPVRTKKISIINNYKQFVGALKTKHNRWKEENEIRLIFRNMTHVNFKLDSLKEIYFGLNVEQVDQTAISKMVLNSGYTPIIAKQKMTKEGIQKHVYTDMNMFLQEPLQHWSNLNDFDNEMKKATSPNRS